MRFFTTTTWAAVALASLFWSTPLQAQPQPHWSLGLKAGYLIPKLSNYEQRFDDPGALLLGLDAGFKPSPRLQLGLEAGYFSDEGRAATVSGVPVSSVKQDLVLLPFQAYLVYRLLFDPDQWLVPYLGGGYSHFTFLQDVEGGGRDSGGQEGFHVRAGVQFLLDALDPRSARESYEDWGLINTYLSLEAQYAKVDDFGNASMDLGGWIYWGGLVFEF